MHSQPPPLLALPAPTAAAPDPAREQAVVAAAGAARAAAAQHLRVHQVYGVPPGAAGVLRRAACPFCGAAHSDADACAACGAPLLPPPDPQPAGPGRRGAPRIERQDRALMSLPGEAATYTVRLHDLSFTGLALEAGLAVRPPGVLRLRAAGFDAVAQVLQCRRTPQGHMLHARLLTLRLLRPAGAFVSARA